MTSRADPTPPGRFRDRVAVVTGAAAGIGRAIAHRLNSEGATTVLLDVQPGVTAVAAELTSSDAPSEALVGDVGDESAWSSAAELADRHGGVDILVSNAATADLSPVWATSTASWDRQLAVNLSATFLGVRACDAGLRRRRGNVVVTSSVHAHVGIPGRPAYAAAKGGLLSLVRQLAVDYGPAVRFNAVVPGPVRTDAWKDIDQDARERSAAATVLGRLGEPAEVAAAVAFLASDDASFITGTSLVIDGGWLAAKDSA